MSNVPSLDVTGSLNLILRIERGARPIRYLFRYEAQPMVECAFCPGHTRHRHGFIVEMDDGRMARCGRCCTRNFFGDEVASALDADLRRREKRQQVEAFLAPVLAGVDAAIHAVKPWLQLEREIDFAVAGLGYTGAGAAVTPDGTIERFRVEIVEGQEMRRDGTMRTVRTPRRTRIGRVCGARALQGHDKRLERAIECLQIIQGKGASETTKMTDNMLSYLKGKRGDAFGMIREGVERIHAAKVLFARENIEELGRWCREQKTKVDVQWMEQASGPMIALRAPRIHGPLQIDVPRIDAVPALDDMLGHLRRKIA